MTFDNPNSIIDSIVEAIKDKKGKNIKVLDLSAIEGGPASAFVIATGNTPTQVSAIADSVQDRLRTESGLKPAAIHGNRNSQWIIADYGSVMVHIFVPEMRDFYDLEGLWSDAPCRYYPDID